MLDFNDAPRQAKHDASAPPIAPDAQAMRAMVDALFRHAPAGLVELSWTSPISGRGVSQARLFELDQLDDLVEAASKLNETRGQNVYVSAGLRREDCPRDRRAKDSDVFAVTAIKADFDNAGALDCAIETLRGAGLAPNLIVITGRIPHVRGQIWFLLEEAASDLDVASELERRLALWLGGDTSIINPSRVMRLVGSIAWPIKDGREVEPTELRRDGTRPQPWTLDELKRIVREAIPPDAKPSGNPFDFNDAGRHGGSTLADLIEESRVPGKWHDAALRATAHVIGKGTDPKVALEMLARALAQPGYSLEQTRAELRVMIEGALRKGYGEKASAENNPGAANVAEDDHLQIRHELWAAIGYSYEPELVEELLPRIGLATLYGPSTVGKSFVALDWMSTIAANLPLLGRDTESVGVLYLAFEGFHGIKKRIQGIKQERGFPNLAFELVDAPWTLSDDKQGPAFRAFVDQAKQRLEDTGFGLGIIVVDTLTSAFAGADANSQAEVSAAMKKLKRLAVDLGCLVLVIGHTGKNTANGMAGSFAFKSESDTFIELRAADDVAGKPRSVYVEKVKDGASGYPIASYSLREVRIGTKPNGKPITTCIVDYGDIASPGDFASQREAEARAREIETRERIFAALLEFLTAQWQSLNSLVSVMREAGLTKPGKHVLGNHLRRLAGDGPEGVRKHAFNGQVIEVRWSLRDDDQVTYFRRGTP